MRHILHTLVKPLFGSLLLYCLLAWPLGGHAQTLDEIRQLSFEGQHEEADRLLAGLLEQHPGLEEILLARAYNFSWMGKYDEAESAFREILLLDPENLPALTGLAYNLAWAGSYHKAELLFRELSQREPASEEGLKGLGYTYLWKGDYAEAEAIFEKLHEQAPDNSEYYLGLGLAQMEGGHVKSARQTLQQAESRFPTMEEPGRLLLQSRTAAPLASLDVWGGYSILDEGENAAGLRSLNLALQLGDQWRPFFKYDHSLSLDILNLARQNQDAHSVSGGTVYLWNKKTLSEVEYGWRLFPDDINQQFVHGAQVFFLPGSLSLKVGGFAGFSSDLSTEWMGYTSMRFPLQDGFYVEPTYYYVRPQDTDSPEHRFLLTVGYRSLGGYEVQLGALYGRGLIEGPSAEKNAFGLNGLAVLPFHPAVWGLLAVRYEKGFYQDFVAISAGLKLRLER